uniref:Fatty-acid amide hydrolase 1 n=1 Tax=Schistocephalus solidus TaxID=70667 RepID=A0A0V0JC20_SCHSO
MIETVAILLLPITDFGWRRLICGFIVAFLVVKLSCVWLQRIKAHAILAEKRRRLTKIRQTSLLHLQKNPQLEHFCSLSTRELAVKIRSGEVQPLQLLHAFQQRAAELLPQNCIAEVILEANDQAKALDLDKQASQSPLFGIPVSFKENLSLKGYDTTLGLIKNLNNPASEDAVVVKVLRSAGAVPFVTTSMPPSGLSMDASSAIYGEQRHFADKGRLAGGSSGGEALLLAGCGSPLGFGSDIAGSLRIPAAFCGISSLKPTFKRLSQFGLVTDYKRCNARLDVCVGPMARKVDSLVDAMRTLLGPEMFSLDPTIPPIPFDEALFSGSRKKSLVIGYYTHFKGEAQVPPAPSVERAVLEVKALLQSQGHLVKEFVPPSPDLAEELLLSTFFSDGGAGLRSALSNEPLPKHMHLLRLSLYIPGFLKHLLAFIAGLFLGKPAAIILSSSIGCHSSVSVLELRHRIAQYEEAFAKAICASDSPFDVIICPTFAYPAPLASTAEIFLDTSLLYTALYNLVDYPAGVVPVGVVTAEDVKSAAKLLEDYRRSGDRTNAALANMQIGSEGLPLAVQVVGRPMQEELVLRVMKEIESSVNFWQ